MAARICANGRLEPGAVSFRDKMNSFRKVELDEQKRIYKKLCRRKICKNLHENKGIDSKINSKVLIWETTLKNFKEADEYMIIVSHWSLQNIMWS